MLSNDQPISDIQLDFTYLRDISGGDTEFMVEMIDIFLQQTPGYCENLEAAIQESNWKVVADISHKIKPTFAFMGLESAKDIMAGIEHKSRSHEKVEEIAAEYNKIKGVLSSLFIRLEEIKKEL